MATAAEAAEKTIYVHTLKSIFLDCKRKPENLEETHTETGRTCKLLIERAVEQDPTEPSHCEASVLTAALLSLLYLHKDTEEEQEQQQEPATPWWNLQEKGDRLCYCY